MTALVVLLLAASPSTLEQGAAGVRAVVAEQHFAAPVGVYVEGAPAPLQRTLASLIASELAAANLGPVVVDAKDATEAEALAIRRQAASLVRATVGLDGTRLIIRGDVISTRPVMVADAATRTGPVGVLALSLDVDAQALTLFGPHPTLELKVSTFSHLAALPAALALGDLDGDKHAEVVTLVDEHVEVRAADGHLLARAELTAPRTSRPTREPFGFVSVSPGRIVAWSARRERPEAFVWLRGALKPTGTVEQLTVESVTLKPEPGFALFSKDFSWNGKPFTAPLELASFTPFGATGFFTFADGSAAVARGVGVASRVTGVGCGSTIGDLDGDGTPELVLTSARASGESDDVRILTLSGFEALQARGAPVAEGSSVWQQPLKARAVLAASGDLDGDGVDEVVLGTWGTTSGDLLLVSRSVTP